MSAAEPGPRYTLLVVPTGGRGEVREIVVTTRHLRQLTAVAAAAALLLLVGMGSLLGLGPTSGRSDPQLQAQLVMLQQTVAEVEAELEQLQLDQARLQAISTGYGPLDTSEIRALAQIAEAVPSGAAAAAVGLRAQGVLARLRWSRRETARLIETELARRDTTPDIWPTQGYLTSGFGMRRSPIDRKWKVHQGLDIGAPRGTPVIAAAAGVVVRANYSSSYGNVVDVRHDDGLMTRYGHNSQLLVAEGQAVMRGDVIALVGSTGRSTGPHLHYEVHVDGEPVDPLEYIRD
ncbi:MAG: murein DD-endopeptidase MepM/ murein hydrolase activator NlpD [Myxococcota bacterium]|jgi:murein DD-endopeptidase MepM/ murein hydrolase activator NlpD